MSLDLHRRAEELMAEAEHLRLVGRELEALEKYRAAASAETDAFEAIPTDRLRTRGIIAVSCVVLRQRAGDTHEAMRLAHHFMGLGSLPVAALNEIELLLDDLVVQRALAAAGRALVPERLEWVMRGPMVSVGSAPMDLVAQKMGQIEKMGVRAYEYLLGHELRRRGPPSADVVGGLSILMSQPAAGSFRFSVQFALPIEQMAMFPTEDATALAPATITALVEELIRAAQLGDAAQLEAIVPDAGYRETFMKMVRNIVPDGRQLTEIEVVRMGETKISSARLTPPVRPAITRLLEARREPKPGLEPIVDTLRGLDLNRGYIVLGQEGRERKCWVGEELVLEDVVGPLVNRPVRVSVHREKNKIVIDDIAPANEGEVE